MKRLIKSEPMFFDLFVDNEDSYIMSVLCGTVGMYELTFFLNQEEILEILVDNNSAAKIADDVRSEPKKYWPRMVDYQTEIE